MGVIYTIAHPLTNEIVYVGASKNLSKRAACHINSTGKTPIAKYIYNLKSIYLLPKIEIIEIGDNDELMFLERYWISQLSAWGFNLLNINKTEVKKKHKIRTSKKWSVDDFKIGKITIINKNERAVFVISFRAQSIKRGFDNVSLNIVKDEGKLICTVVDKVEKSDCKYRLSKNGNRCYYQLKPKKEKPIKILRRVFKYGFKNRIPGDIQIIDLIKIDSFRVSMGTHNKTAVNKLYANYKINSENNTVEINYCTLENYKRSQLPKGMGRDYRVKLLIATRTA